MTELNRYKEPWRLDITGQTPWVRDNSDRWLMSLREDDKQDGVPYQLLRAMHCVNALAGISDEVLAHPGFNEFVRACRLFKDFDQFNGAVKLQELGKIIRQARKELGES